MLQYMTNQPVEVRDNGGTETISGYAAVFFRDDDEGTQFELFDGFVERIMPEAFTRAITEDDVRGLFNHSPDHILGRNKAGTLRLAADNIGLRYEIDLPKTQTGRDVAESIRRGDVSGSSFAFEIVDQRQVREAGFDVREIHSVKLYDVGPVTYPAYAATTASMRSIGDPDEAARKMREFSEKQAEAVRTRIRLLTICE